MSEQNTEILPVNVNTGSKQPPGKENTISFIKRNPVLITVLVCIIALAAVYLWKDIQAKNQEAAMAKRAETQLLRNTSTMLKLVAKPLVWSIRAEMLRGNMEQVDIFMSDLVKEKNFQFIYLVNPEGKIILSTDKKMEGQPVGDLFKPELLKTDSAVVVSDTEGMLTLAAPVMGFDKELAVIILNYTAVRFNRNVDNKDQK